MWPALLSCPGGHRRTLTLHQLTYPHRPIPTQSFLAAAAAAEDLDEVTLTCGMDTSASRTPTSSGPPRIPRRPSSATSPRSALTGTKDQESERKVCQEKRMSHGK
ncbi:hypothetical protein ACQJBY_017764 [Aegilops geniculata]